jgi:hypothetical protein
MKPIANNVVAGAGVPAPVVEPAVKIEAMPGLTAEQKLEARLSEVEASLAKSEKDLEASEKFIASLRRERDTAVESVKKMEANVLMLALGQLDAGTALQEAGMEFCKVVEAVAQLGAAGSLSLKVTVKPVKDLAGPLQVDMAVKSTIPKEKAQPALFYPLEGGLLSRKDPRQRELDLDREDRRSK